MYSIKVNFFIPIPSLPRIHRLLIWQNIRAIISLYLLSFLFIFIYQQKQNTLKKQKNIYRLLTTKFHFHFYVVLPFFSKWTYERLFHRFLLTMDACEYISFDKLISYLLKYFLLMLIKSLLPINNRNGCKHITYKLYYIYESYGSFILHTSFKIQQPYLQYIFIEV